MQPVVLFKEYYENGGKLMAELKNIFYFHTHDTGRYIEPYGYKIKTPNLMRLAEEGTLFRKAFSTAPTCSPSRAGMLTGRSPHAAGMTGLAHRGFANIDYSQHLVQFLNNKGFETVLCGMQHEAEEAEEIGYDLILDKDETEIKDLENAKRTVQYLKNRTNNQPLFLSYGMEYTHREFPEVDSDINPDYVNTPESLPDIPDIRKDMAAFIISAERADRCLGILIDAIKEVGIEDESLIIYTTDHGIAFPFMKSTLNDGGIGVSLILKFPDNPKKGETLDSLVSQLDIFPSICDLFNFEFPSYLEGSSIMPLFTGEKDEIREEIFAEVSYHAAYEPMRAVRTKRYKFIKFFGKHDKIVPANIDDSPSKDFLVENGYLDTKRDTEMLFDLYFDPNEKNNLVNEESYQNIYHKLKNKLDNWMRQTDDPLLKGEVSKPEGALVNRMDTLSPESGEFE